MFKQLSKLKAGLASYSNYIKVKDDYLFWSDGFSLIKLKNIYKLSNGIISLDKLKEAYKTHAINLDALVNASSEVFTPKYDAVIPESKNPVLVNKKRLIEMLNTLNHNEVYLEITEDKIMVTNTDRELILITTMIQKQEKL